MFWDINLRNSPLIKADGLISLNNNYSLCSLTDKAPASEAGNASSILAKGTDKSSKLKYQKSKLNKK